MKTMEESLAATNAVNASLIKALDRLTSNCAGLSEQQRTTTAALGTITQQLAAMAHRMEQLSMPSPAAMHQSSFAMNPYQPYMAPPMTMAALQQGMLAAGALSAPTPYVQNPTAQHNMSYAQAQQQLPLPGQRNTQADMQPMQLQADDPSLTAESSAITNPAHNGMVGING